MSYWRDEEEGIIFIYVAEEFEGDLKEISEEGCIEWIDIKDLSNLKQFSQNEKFTPYLFKEELFEGKFLLDEKCNVLEYEIRTIQFYIRNEIYERQKYKNKLEQLFHYEITAKFLQLKNKCLTIMQKCYIIAKNK